jgi:DNA helicase-2/ATP-dependent DNA helicase PcrA
MLDFAQQYAKDLLTVVMTNNYRSTQPILDISRTLIERNRNGLCADPGALQAAGGQPSPDRQLHYPPQAAGIPEPATGDDGDHPGGGKAFGGGVAPGRIAIIYKENKYGEELAASWR